MCEKTLYIIITYALIHIAYLYLAIIHLLLSMHITRYCEIEYLEQHLRKRRTLVTLEFILLVPFHLIGSVN